MPCTDRRNLNLGRATLVAALAVMAGAAAWFWPRPATVAPTAARGTAKVPAAAESVSPPLPPASAAAAAARPAPVEAAAVATPALASPAAGLPPAPAPAPLPVVVSAPPTPPAAAPPAAAPTVQGATPAPSAPPAQPAPVAAVPAARVAESVVPLARLTPEQRRDWPALAIGGAVYSDNAASRLLIVGGQLLHEGDAAAPGVTIARIGPRAVLLRWRELLVEVPL